MRRRAKQLGLLLWKNLLLKWRGGSVPLRIRAVQLKIPCFLLLEVVWPVLLYVIIVVLRGQFPPENHVDEVYRANALPSSGALPFLQTLMCDLDGGPDPYLTDLPLYPNATVNQVYSVLEDLSAVDGGQWEQVCRGLRALGEQVQCVNSTARLSSQQCQGAEVPLTCFLRDPAHLRSYLSTELSLNETVVDAILTANVSRPQLPFDLPNQSGRSVRQAATLPFPDILSGLLPSNLSGDSLRLLVCNNTGVLDQLVTFGDGVSANEVAGEVCALNDSQLQGLSDELQDQLNTECSAVGEELQGLADVLSLQEALGGVQNLANISEGGGGQGNSTEDFFCGEAPASDFIKQVLDRVEHGDSFQRAELKHNVTNSTSEPDVFRLKIMYYPHNSFTSELMAKANRTFSTAAFIMEWAGEVANCSDYFLDNFPPYSQPINTTRESLATLTAGQYNVSALQTLFPGLARNLSLDNDSLAQAQTLLDPEAPGNVWETVSQIRDAAQGIHDALAMFDWDVYLPMNSSQALEELAADYDWQQRLNISYLAAGIVFDDGIDYGVTNVSVKIRMNFSVVHDTSEFKESVWTPGPENRGWKRVYLQGWFIFIQDLMERAVAEQLAGVRIASPGLYLQQMPYPCYKEDRFMTANEWVLPLAMIFAWLFPVAMTVRDIVREKEKRLKELMKMMGLSEGVLRLSWVLTSGAELAVSVVIITLLLKVGGVLPYSNWLLVLLFLALYAIVMLSYSFLMSVFFNNANLAACVASLLYFMVFFAQITLIPKQQFLSPALLGLCGLWAPLAFGLGATYLVQLELQEKGLQWSNLISPAIQDDNLTPLAIFVILAFDTLLYLVLTWYIEGVWPGRYGVAKPFYFPFMPSYWLGQRGRGVCPSRRTARHMTLQENDDSELKPLAEDCEGGEGGAVCEDDPSSLPLGITIASLSKTYHSGLPRTRWRKTVHAVKDLSLNFYEGQITAFLGHNGAGKTTTMSVLTGLFEPTAGTAHIYGLSIKRHMDMIRQSLGMCPQHNILFDNLTVREHFLFYSQLKGASRRAANESMAEWLAKVNLLPHADKLARHLSGGMKRKLSILLAFVGGSRTIILDEPTSGVDPFARRQIWDFLLRHRHGRTIMLSTHHMDEAEILGDRIAIISNGSLLCCGSFEFLKHRFGRGHQLTLVAAGNERRSSTSSRTFTVTADVEETDHAPPSSPDPAHFEAITQNAVERIATFIQGFVPSARLEETRGRDLRFLLPLHQSHPHTLTRLFAQLELQSQRLGVASYGLTACSMEEIFIKLTEDELKEKTEDPADAMVPRPSLPSAASLETTPIATPTSSTPSGEELEEEEVFDEEGLLFGDTSCDDHLGSGEPTSHLTGCQLWTSQFLALTVKRFHYTRRKTVALVIQNVFPLVIIALSLAIARALQDVPNPPPLELSPYTFFSKAEYNYLFVGGYQGNETQSYFDSAFQPCGVGGHWLGSGGDPSSVCYDDPSHDPNLCDNTTEYLCTCPRNECNDTTPFPDHISCYNGTGSGTRLQDVSVPLHPLDSEYANDALTTYLLRSKNSFIEQRYGGFSFGHTREEVAPVVDEDNMAANVTQPFLATREAAKVWYTLKGYHAMPSVLNAMNNVLLRANLDHGENNTKYGITTISHPFNISTLHKAFYAVSEKASFLVNPLAAIFSLGFVAAGVVLMLIEERSGKIKHLQQVCGMNRIVYWLSTFCWDMLWFLTFIGIVLLLFVAFQDQSYISPDTILPFVVILVSYGWAVIPWMYAFSFLFSSPATAYVLLFCLNFFSGFALLIVDAIVVYVEEISTSDFLHYTLVWAPFPAYQLARGMMYFSLDRPILVYAASFTFEPLPNIWGKLWPFLLVLWLQGLLYMLLVLLWEVLPGLKCASGPRCSSVNLPAPMENEDRAVARERRRANKADRESDILTLRNLSKVYGSGVRYRVAVNNLCLAMQKAECFGLLGVNGAGKTTTFRMLTGDTHSTSGEAVIASHNVQTSLGPVQQAIGYCPQVDALIDTLTARQHLTLYCKLRGLHSKEVSRVVDWALLKLGLSQYADKPAGTYSGGNRRKLSTAIALLARPRLILLDEPTSGVDPRARRFLWSIIRGAIGAGQSVLLTTHSMAECEALCSRVGIMVNGEFRCLGSPQQLKSTYGKGYRLKVRVSSHPEAVREYVRQNFVDSVLKEDNYSTLVYQLPTAGMELSKAFELMEKARETLDIQDYSLSQTTLDDVFIHFANEQSEEAWQLRAGESPTPAPATPPLPDLVAATGASRSSGGVVTFTSQEEHVQL